MSIVGPPSTRLWHCTLHPLIKFEWINPIFKNVSVVKNLKECANGNTCAKDVVGYDM